MKRKLITISVIQILLISGLYFLLSYFISDDSVVASLLRGALFGLIYFFVFPKAYQLFLWVKKPKYYKLEENEQLNFKTDVYIIGAMAPEKVILSITNQNLIYRIYREDKIISLEEINNIKFKPDEITFYYNYGTKKTHLNFITDEAEEILKNLPLSIQKSNLS
ncbi:hypothetical protein [Mesonia maritima]|uniref:Uncharacterized protein n=1 Tax=Mesonia maritima TaxID=1793873 RepID=A0ABU1K2P2_9FLAO|nr:hypothetical protein [Mesonia maritima]MDR6299879.1 hypothetical protein [Mesonia maritima]